MSENILNPAFDNKKPLFISVNKDITIYNTGDVTVNVVNSEETYGYNLVSNIIDCSSISLNKLKAKLYNLIESVITNDNQCNSIKGLIKGFCNDSYDETENDLIRRLNDLGIEPTFYSSNYDKKDQCLGLNKDLI